MWLIQQLFMHMLHNPQRATVKGKRFFFEAGAAHRTRDLIINSYPGRKNYDRDAWRGCSCLSLL